MKRNCDNCKIEYEADERNLKRGWGLCCSKSCAAKKRETSKPNYNSKRVELNNFKRNNWNFKRKTSEGYDIIGTTAVDEFGDKVYEIDQFD